MSLDANILLLSPGRNKTWQYDYITGGTQASEGHKHHGHHTGPKQDDYNVRSNWVHGEAASCWSHCCCVVFVDPDREQSVYSAAIPQRIDIWLCVSMVKVRRGDRGSGQLV